MTTPFERLPFILESEDLLDKAFSKAARAGRAKSGIDAQKSMTVTASNILHDNLENIVRQFPSFDELPEFYREIARASVNVDEVKQSLSSLDWASDKVKEIGREAQSEIARASDTEEAIQRRKRAFARMSSILEEVEDDLDFLGEIRAKLVKIPEVGDHPTVVLAGYPNVGKSTFLERVTRANPEIKEYPFTTKGIGVGHFEREYLRYQIIDTPGLLDRPLEERNEMEIQSIKSLELLAEVIIFFLDPSEYCGYDLESQLELRDEIRDNFDVPLITVANKSDLYDEAQVSEDVLEGSDADYVISLKEDEGVEEVLEASLEYLPSASKEFEKELENEFEE